MKTISRKQLLFPHWGIKTAIAIIFLFIISNTNAQQYTSILDENFEKALIAKGIDKAGLMDGKVLTSDISGVKNLYLYNRNIKDLSGIEGFTSLVYLNCGYNKIESLDISKNVLLEQLICYNNPLGHLDVSKNLALKLLYCQHNDLSGLDISNNVLLESLACQSNELTNLDVTSNIKLKLLFFSGNKITKIDLIENKLLERLECSGNEMRELNLEKNTKLKSLYCYDNKISRLDLSNNPFLEYIKIIDNNLNRLNLKSGGNQRIKFIRAKRNLFLTCVSVDNPEDFKTRLGYGFASIMNFVDNKNYCGRVSVNFIRKKTSISDANFERYLRSKGLDGTGDENDGEVFTDLIEAEVVLHLGGKGISNLTGIEDFKDLRYLYCNNSEFVNLDLSRNPQLRKVYCHNNPFLERLNLNNVNNAVFYGRNNPKLTCVSVDNPNFFIRDHRDKFDPMVSFVVSPDDCNINRGRSRRSVQGESVRITQIPGRKITVDVPGERVERIEIWNRKIRKRLRTFKNQQEYSISGLRKKIIHIRIITNKRVLNKRVWLKRS